MKELRVRFSEIGDQEDQYPSRAPSFRKDDQMDKRGLNEAAIAAAAFAIMSREEQTLLKQKGKLEDAKNTMPLSRTNTDTDNTGSTKFIRWLSGKDTKDQDPKPSVLGDGTIARSSTTTPEKRKQDAERILMEKHKNKDRTAPSFKKTPTFSDNYQDRETYKQFDKKREQTGIQPSSLTSNNSKMQGPLPGETKADAWERAQMAKIRERFEKMNITILEWENEKRTKAKRKLERKERELEKRRLKAQTEYREEEIRINKIAAGARSLAEEQKRKEEAKAIEKARKMRTTPKSSCPCF